MSQRGNSMRQQLLCGVCTRPVEPDSRSAAVTAPYGTCRSEKHGGHA